MILLEELNHVSYMQWLALVAAIGALPIWSSICLLLFSLSE